MSADFCDGRKNAAKAFHIEELFTPSPQSYHACPVWELVLFAVMVKRVCVCCVELVVWSSGIDVSVASDGNTAEQTSEHDGDDIQRCAVSADVRATFKRANATRSPGNRCAPLSTSPLQISPLLHHHHYCSHAPLAARTDTSAIPPSFSFLRITVPQGHRPHSLAGLESLVLPFLLLNLLPPWLLSKSPRILCLTWVTFVTPDQISAVHSLLRFRADVPRDTLNESIHLVWLLAYDSCYIFEKPTAWPAGQCLHRLHCRTITKLGQIPSEKRRD
nr:hypothetical protein CFP56_62437 [Quercus suber]